MRPGGDFAAALMAGGRSRRMGEDKAFLEVEGLPLWNRQLTLLRTLEPRQLILSANATQDFAEPGEGVSLVRDSVAEQGPLAGLVAVLEACRHPRVLVIAVDMPRLNADFLRKMTKAGRAVVFRDESGRFEPFPAIYPSVAAERAKGALAEGRLALQDFLRDCVAEGLVEVWPVAEEERAFFQSWNVPSDRVGLDASPESTEIEITRIRLGAETDTTRSEMDAVAVEEPLEIRVEGRSLAVVMRTPGHDDELAAGFLLSENVIRSRRDIFEISQCPSQSVDGEGVPKGNVVDVLLSDASGVDWDSLTRHVFSASSCGICGKATIDSVIGRIDPLPPAAKGTVAPEVIAGLPDKLREAQRTFRATGGLHASALFDLSGALLLLREDVGRHNALDKVIGHSLLHGRLPLEDVVLLLSGRVSFELMQKAHAAGIAVVAAISAPSSLAIGFARESGQTLIGFLRGGTMNVYAGGARLSSLVES